MSSLPLGYHLATILTAAAEEDGDHCDPALLCPHLSKAALLSPQRRSRSTSSSSSKPKLSSRLQLSGFSSTINNMPYVVNEASLSCFDLVDEDSLVWNNNMMDSSTSCDTTVASSCSGRTGTTRTTTSTATTVLRRSSSSWNSLCGDEDDAHHVMFHAEPTIHMIPNRTDDFSAQEIRLSWYQEADIARMKQEARHDNKQQQQQQRPWTLRNDRNTKQNQSRIQQRRKRASWESDASRYLSALVGVLEEQERQRLCSDCSGINEDNGTSTTSSTRRRKCVVWDTELLAQVYRFHSLPAAKEARIIARQHRDSSRE
jgi:hypothetical protein